MQNLNQLLQHELELLRSEHGFPGATVAYALADGSVDTLATGFSDIEAETPMIPKSRMLAASIGKSFVAATLLALANEGLLKIDDSLSKWLGDRPWFSRLANHSKITLRHLLTHSSGLQDHVNMARFLQAFSEGWQKPGNPSPPEALITCILDEPALFEPGRGWMYTDTGYILLGLVIEKAAKKSYYEEIERRFLKPLKLNETGASDRPELPGVVAGYTAHDNSFGLPVKTTLKPGLLAWNPAMEWTGGGLISTSFDLARWAKLLYEGQAMKIPYLDDLLRSVPTSNEDDGIFYGAGVAIYKNGPFGTTYGHGGVIPGYSSSMRYYTKYRVACAFQINTDIGVWDHSTELVSNMEHRLAKIIIGKVSSMSAIL